MNRLWHQRFQNAARRAVTGSAAHKSVFAKTEAAMALSAFAVGQGGVTIPLVDPAGNRYFMIGVSDVNAETDAIDNHA